ncbi:MAG TPA: hypothetical protein VKR30_00810 [Candidatus Limnocylindrales bacterium]|nr:hypothetical protein [Candidatus Limnocylindrales bacterium]
MTDRRIDLRVPPHVVVMLGLSTAAYAVSLAGVATNEASSEAAAAADRAPALTTIDDLTTADDRVAAGLGTQATDYSTASGAYATAVSRLAAFEASLGNLAASVSAINGVAQALPASVPLPAVVRSVSLSTSGTHATTGASGVP